MKTRIITGSILIIVVFGAILFLPHSYFMLLLILLGGFAFFEWRGLLNLTKGQGNLYLIVTVTLLILVMSPFITMDITRDNFPLLVYDKDGSWLQGIVQGVLVLVAFIWLLMPFLLLRHSRRPVKIFSNKVFLIPFSFGSIVSFILALTFLKGWGESLLMATILLVVIADSGAYFVGKRFGRVKLAPTISPGKTVEGAIGGIGLSLFYGGILLIFLPLTGRQNANFLLLIVIAVLVSIAGDLFESILKRERGVKDSGSLLPGHGGVLDRIDALIAASPVVLLGMKAMALLDYL